MLDPFLFGHKPISFTGNYESFPDSFFRIQETIVAQSKLGGFWDEALNETRNVTLYTLVFQMAMEEVLQDMRAMSMIERLVLESILLHRIRLAIHRADEVQGNRKRASAILGAMFQQRLSIVLATVRTRDAQRLFYLHRSGNIDSQEWRDAFVGTAAAAKVIRIVRQLDHVEMYLPTIEEDIESGVDLFVLRDDTLFALSIKTGKLEDGATWAELATRKHVDERTYSKYTRQCNEIARGAQMLATTIVYPIVPVLVHASAGAHGCHDVAPMDEDVVMLRDVIDDVFKQKRGPPLAPASEKLATNVA